MRFHGKKTKLKQPINSTSEVGILSYREKNLFQLKLSSNFEFEQFEQVEFQLKKVKFQLKLKKNSTFWKLKFNF